MADTGLLGGIVLMMVIKHTYETKACTNCYHPVYNGEDLRSLFRVHTNVNPNCFDHSQLNTCQEDGKVYWTTKNTASYAQRLFGECPIGDTWLCFEADHKGLRDIIKEKVLTTKIEKGLDIPSGKNLFIDLVERISRELNLTECWICGVCSFSRIWAEISRRTDETPDPGRGNPERCGEWEDMGQLLKEFSDPVVWDFPREQIQNPVELGKYLKERYHDGSKGEKMAAVSWALANAYRTLLETVGQQTEAGGKGYKSTATPVTQATVNTPVMKPAAKLEPEPESAAKPDSKPKPLAVLW
ncbi:hypothetical protein DUI87_19787 [Hirundo rustica rustica]|uniref:Uncharacterized protein n=1 Tax=Hirundo rustica rustica TaxID=333673 RepID=A0A3M0JRI5_HIRRU|nr:hypothetical protein DUI87_19787 [Hirundo rustica rustica]